ncbi:MAG: Asp-tRNA(Asn)/Glu-tRNA(Gln) amidotransferase subunit GatC [Alphaproteobacteria bacterium]|nr:Asp-tRNA(Asn)/Glu-tRNA(Gln) amidotransferase subunit GatC [Alphaproteobacteria bacterium]
MSVDTQTVRKIAYLSHLRIDDDKMTAFEAEFNKIIDWVQQLNEVNTDNVEPLVSVNDTKLTLRADKVVEGNQADKILKNAPLAEYDYFVVPKVVE